jgi:hypothetical protein
LTRKASQNVASIRSKAFDNKNSEIPIKLSTSFYAGGLVVLIVAGLYLFTLDNGLRPDELTGGDLITHQYAQVEGRPSNAPGYPLYTMGGWLWFRLGRAVLSWAFNPIQILSLYSTWWSLTALLVLYLVLLQVTLRQWVIALLLTAFYATTYFFWYYSVTTEQYTSAVFQTLLLIWLTFRWDEHPRDSTLLWLAFLTGTMLANMVTTVFIVPPLLWFIFSRRDLTGLAKLSGLYKPKFILLAIGLVCLPLLSYAYVFISGALHPEWRGSGEWPSTWAWFVQFLTIQQGRDELTSGLTWQTFFTREFPALMWQELTWPIFWGGLVGLAFLGKRRAIFLYSSLLIYFVFCWLYRFGNWFQVIIPAYPIFIIGAAAGLAQVSGVRRQGSGVKLYALYVVLILLLLYRFTTNLPRANQRDLPTDTGLDPGWAILADQPTSPAIISSDFAEQVALQYLKTVWCAAPGIYSTSASDFTSPPELGQADSLSYYITRRAVAAAPNTVRLSGEYPQAAGEQLILLAARPVTELPPDPLPLDLPFGDALKLVGWEPVKTDYPLPEEVAARLPRANWQIALYWQTSQALAEDYTISVRPLVEGQVISVNGEALIQDHQPMWGFYPTSRWQPGIIVRDVYALSLPVGVNPDTVQIVVYKATSTGFKNLAEQTIVTR